MCETLAILFIYLFIYLFFEKYAKRKNEFLNDVTINNNNENIFLSSINLILNLTSFVSSQIYGSIMVDVNF